MPPTMLIIQRNKFIWIYILVLIFFCISFVKIWKFSNKTQYFGTKNIKPKYIGSVGFGGRLGNQVWRLASLYGIGRYTDRKIFFQSSAFENKREGYFVNLTELGEIFPNILTHVNIKNPLQNNIKKVSFATDCCKYDNPEKLRKIPDEFIEVDGDYLQSYKFFHSYESEIKDIFKCSQNVISTIKSYSKKLFQEDTSIKICTYIRRGDFLTDLMLESEADFVVPAIDYVYNYYTNEKNVSKISLVFIGNDPVFAKNMSLEKQNFYNIYYPQLNNPGEDMCFGINFCDSTILTASGSTFGWWMSYLKEREGPVFYNSQVTDYGNHSKDIHDFDFFPASWIKLTVKDKVAFKETQWWYERNNLLPDLPSNEL